MKTHRRRTGKCRHWPDTATHTERERTSKKRKGEMPSPQSFSLSFLCSYSVLLLFLVSTTTTSAASDPFIYGGCSRQKYSPISSYQTNLDSLLASLATASASGLYSHSSAGKPDDPDAVSGVVQCRGDLPTTDCLTCVQDAISQLRLLCADATGAAIQLDSCFLKYDNATFVGVLDTTLIYKRCGPPAYDPGLLGQRDDVSRQLSDGGGGGSYRTASSGAVYGVAQCVGDLSPGDCSKCVSQAVEKLKEACGSSISGDAFLGKCYARFSSSSSPSFSSSTSSGTYPQPNHGNSLSPPRCIVDTGDVAGKQSDREGRSGWTRTRSIQYFVYKSDPFISISIIICRAPLWYKHDAYHESILLLLSFFTFKTIFLF